MHFWAIEVQYRGTQDMQPLEMIIRTETLFSFTRLFENYCFVLLTNRAPPQISDNRPDMRRRALFVTSRAAWRWNKMLLARDPSRNAALPTGKIATSQCITNRKGRLGK